VVLHPSSPAAPATAAPATIIIPSRLFMQSSVEIRDPDI
jgi:hypothetical protein